MELSLQAKLLRVLEEGSFRRVGGLKDIKLDARIIAASNRNLKQESEGGNFRLDLYFRLSIIQVDIPPLRDRGKDVILLAKYYIDKVNLKRRGKQLTGLSPEVERIFLHYRWSGNVRELRNVIERASILEDGQIVTSAHLPGDMLGGDSGSNHGSATVRLPADGVSLETVEFELARQAIERTGGNLTRASKLLDISRDQLRYKLRKAGYDFDQSETE
jgi:two-component system NtrC family response regulator